MLLKLKKGITWLQTLGGFVPENLQNMQKDNG